MASTNQDPVAAGERLTFNLYWPSGIPLGEAVLQAAQSGAEVRLEATVTADLPQHHVSYNFSSLADPQLCSLRFSETLREGSKTRQTTYEFDQVRNRIRRTQDGQVAELPASPCARDPLALLYHFRRQLAAGSLPAGGTQSAGTFYLGAEYAVDYQALASETVKVGVKAWQGERFQITATGGGSVQSLEVWFHPESARLPVAVRVPFSLATFSAELQ
ncbi:MAG TPA: DUF3108 domain-containing protein [Terriglobia bacterium]|nr:DUF3108 domain-containing protein [Terriglobia bacterium]